MSSVLFTNGQVFDGEQIHTNKSVLVENGLVATLSDTDSCAVKTETYNLEGRLLAPGFIDIQVNGGGGVLFNNAPCIDTLRTMAKAHRRFGTIGLLPTFISDADGLMQDAVSAVNEALAHNVPGILGIHLEGPCLNSQRKGVHSEKYLRNIDAPLFKLITSLKAGKTLLTLAPELAGNTMIKALHTAGVVVFAGHSAATYEDTMAAFDSGLRGFTHLFNAMPPLLSRVPGIVGAALTDEESYVGIIADGFHVHPASFSIAVAAKQKGKSLLVTDAMSSVGSSIGSGVETEGKTFTLYGEVIKVEGGRCVTQGGVLAGSDLNMLDAVKNTMKFTGLSKEEALRMASTYPAQAIHLGDELGFIKPGYRACFVELDEAMNVVQTWIDGHSAEDDD